MFAAAFATTSFVVVLPDTTPLVPVAVALSVSFSTPLGG